VRRFNLWRFVYVQPLAFWIRDVDALHDLLQHHGPDRVRLAFEDGLRAQVFGAPHIARALQVADSLCVEGTIQ
jgi:hypothetical protein